MKKLFVVAFLFILMISACANSSSSRSADSNMMSAYQDLLSKEEVKEVINRLFISTDNRDWETVSQLFAEEVLFKFNLKYIDGNPNLEGS